MKDRTTKTLKIDTNLHRELKIKSAKENIPMIDLAEDYIQEGLKKEELEKKNKNIFKKT